MNILARLLPLCIVLSACNPAPGGIVDDRQETQIREFVVPGSDVSAFVLFGKPSATICGYRKDSAKELIALRSQAKPYRDAYSYVDVQRNGAAKYQFYFKEADVRSPSDASYLVCSGNGPPPSQCSLLGISSAGCYEEHGSSFTFAQLAFLAQAVSRDYPTW